MQPLWKFSPDASHDDLFIERYDRLLRWSLGLTDNNRGVAEDLVHDAFIQFTFTHPDLRTIHDLDNYLYGMLRNLHLSQVRRATRSRLQPLSIVEYESVEAGLKSIDPRDQIQVQDELRRACHYACVRKESAKIASVLILRFFHGYYPSEIVQIMRSSRAAVRESLRIARTEAKLYLDNPKALGLIGSAPAASNVESFKTSFARSTRDFLGELRRMIFQSRQRECRSVARFEELYSSTSTGTIDCPTLAHIVSCEVCLDEVNRLLNLPLLAERYPTDTIGQDKRKKGGPGGGPAGGEGTEESKRKYQRWKRDFFEHEPQELCVSVNGHLESSQKISSPLSDLTVSIKGEEQVNFVEVFSEQNVRLLLHNVIELPPNGSDEQTSRVELSDNRTLELVLRFRSPWPTVQVTYHDPTYAEPGTINIEQENYRQASTYPLLTEMLTARSSILNDPARRLRARLSHTFAGWRFWFQPATVTAAFALILIAAFALLYLRAPRPVATPASDLLARAASAEETIAAATDQVLHRTINLEEKRADGALIARRRIEVWQSAAQGITARRLYDEQNKLVAGDWRRSDGVATLYHHGKNPQIQSSSSRLVIRNFDDVWVLEPSAKDFSSLIGDDATVGVEDRGSLYILYAESVKSEDTSSPAVKSATLVLNKTDLHPIAETLLIQQGSELREFHFMESSFERRAPDAVSPAIFEPDPELLSADTEARRNNDTANVSTSPSLPVSVSPVAATADLEVEVLRLLHEARADLGEQVSVTKGADGLLHVTGLIDGDARKAELMRALQPVANNPACRIDIQTVAEAVALQKKGTKLSPRSNATPAPVREQNVEIENETIAAAPELRRHFASDEQLREFSAHMVSQSRSAMSYAGAIKRLLRQFSSDELRSLSPEAREKWLALIRSHVLAYQSDAQKIRRELRPIFFPNASEVVSNSSAGIDTDASLTHACDRLFELAAANDSVIRSAFAVSSGASASSAISSAQFWQSMKSAENLAALISRAR